jgi:anti-sigma regulatory factor (Ser/Thr protein kinase)
VVEETYGSRLGQETLRPASGRKPADAGTSLPVGTPEPVLFDRTFGRDEIAVVRHEVQRHLRGTGVDSDRLHGFVFAVNEVITNVVVHGGGHGRIVVWLTAGSAWCTVTDSGPGIPECFHSQPDFPEVFELGGRGIWLAHQLCDEVTVATGQIGTTIGLRVALSTTPRPRM